MGTTMALSMAAMMAPTAAPFFVGYARATRRPAALATVVAVYLAAWAAVGFAVSYVMGDVMITRSSPVVGIAVAIALGYALTPWGRWAREECRRMSLPEVRAARLRDALAEGAKYTACCVVCSAGAMFLVAVLGMSNPIVLTAGAAVVFVYKVAPWPVRPPLLDVSHSQRDG